MAKKTLTLLELTGKTCKWPIGDPKEKGFHFCGDPITDGYSYCLPHAVVGYSGFKGMPTKAQKRARSLR